MWIVQGSVGWGATRGRIPAAVWSGWPGRHRPRRDPSSGSDPCCHERSCPAEETGLWDKYNKQPLFHQKQRKEEEAEKKQLWFLVVFIVFPGAEPQAVFVVLENVTNTWCEIWKEPENAAFLKSCTDPSNKLKRGNITRTFRSLLRLLDWTSAQ